MRTHVDLFSGIGGFALAAEWAGVETIAFAEIDSYASRVIKRRFAGVRNYGDVRTVPTLDAWLVTGGVPCQPASIAGQRKGTADDRWLWPEALAAVERIKPAWVCLENPLGILSLEQPGLSLDLEGYGNLIETAIRSEGDFWAAVTGEIEFIFRDLVSSVEKLGYEVVPVVIPACGLGAWHRRYRVWIMGHATGLQPRAEQQPTSGGGIVANTNGGRTHTEPQRVTERESPTDADRDGEIRSLADASGNGRATRISGSDERQKRLADFIINSSATSFAQGEPKRTGLRETEQRGVWRRRPSDDSWWATEPGVGRVVDGLPARLDRLRGLGNSIVPQVAYRLISAMIEAEQPSS